MKMQFTWVNDILICQIFDNSTAYTYAAISTESSMDITIHKALKNHAVTENPKEKKLV